MAEVMQDPKEQAMHIPVLISDILARIAPMGRRWVDGTFGAGGYSRALLEAGAVVHGIDRDPNVAATAQALHAEYPDRFFFHAGSFSEMRRLIPEAQQPVDGIVLDIGVSSMQLDQAARGFSFMREGPLDMRMAQEGLCAADLVNGLEEADLADLLYHYGEERASRRIARAIVRARSAAPITTTLELATIISDVMPLPRGRHKGGGKGSQIHPATRSFQALRIAVNDELGELAAALDAAQDLLRPGGVLAVVSFHSLEDRIVKRFMQHLSGKHAGTNRYQPAQEAPPAPFSLLTRKGIRASEEEARANPRARSAVLRMARRLDAPRQPIGRQMLGMPPDLPGGLMREGGS